MITPRGKLGHTGRRTLTRGLTTCGTKLDSRRIRTLVTRAERLQRCRRRPSGRRSLLGVPVLNERSVGGRTVPFSGGRRGVKRVPIIQRRTPTGNVSCVALVFRYGSVTRRRIPCLKLLHTMLKCIGAESCDCTSLTGTVGVCANKVSDKIDVCPSLGGRSTVTIGFRVHVGILRDGLRRTVGLTRRVLGDSSLRSAGQLTRLVTRIGSELRIGLDDDKRAMTTVHTLSCRSICTFCGSTAVNVTCGRVVHELSRRVGRGPRAMTRGLRRLVRGMFIEGEVLIDFAKRRNSCRGTSPVVRGCLRRLPRKAPTRTTVRPILSGGGRKFASTSRVRCITESNGFVDRKCTCRKALGVLGVVLDCRCL